MGQGVVSNAATTQELLLFEDALAQWDKLCRRRYPRFNGSLVGRSYADSEALELMARRSERITDLRIDFELQRERDACQR